MNGKRARTLRKYARNMSRADTVPAMNKLLKKFWRTATPKEKDRLPKMDLNEIINLIRTYCRHPSTILGK